MRNLQSWLTKYTNFIVIFINLILIYALLRFSGLILSFEVHLVLYFLGIISGLTASKSLNHFNKMKYQLKLLLFFIVLFITYAIIGNPLFIYPLNKAFEFSKLLLYILSTIPIFFISLSAIHYFDLLEAKFVTNNTKYKANYFFAFFAISMLVSLLYVIAFNPGVLTYDSFDVISQAKNLKEITDWHPAFLTLLYRLLLSIYDSPLTIVIAQITFFNLITASFFTFLVKKGLNIKFTLFLCCALSILPNVSGQLIILWKDIPYAASLLWLTLLIAKLLINQKLNQWELLQLTICLFFVYIFRKNGIIPFALSFLLFLFLAFKNKKVILPIIGSISLILITLGPVYDYYNVKRVGNAGQYIGLTQDLVAVKMYNGNLTDKALTYVNEMTSETKAYSPYWVDVKTKSDLSLFDFMVMYFENFIKNPQIMMNSIFCRVDVGWNIFPGVDSIRGLTFETIDKIGIEPFDSFYPARNENILTEAFYVLGSASLFSSLNTLFWRTGISFSILLLALWHVLSKSKYSYCLILIPVIGQIVSLLISTGWSDYRYYWPIFLVSFFFILISLCIKKDTLEEEKI